MNPAPSSRLRMQPALGSTSSVLFRPTPAASMITGRPTPAQRRWRGSVLRRISTGTRFPKRRETKLKSARVLVLLTSTSAYGLVTIVRLVNRQSRLPVSLSIECGQLIYFYHAGKGGVVYWDNVSYNVNYWNNNNLYSIGISLRSIRDNEHLDLSRLKNGDACGQFVLRVGGGRK